MSTLMSPTGIEISRRNVQGDETFWGEMTRGEPSWGAKRLGEEMDLGRNNLEALRCQSRL